MGLSGTPIYGSWLWGASCASSVLGLSVRCAPLPHAQQQHEIKEVMLFMQARTTWQMPLALALVRGR